MGKRVRMNNQGHGEGRHNSCASLDLKMLQDKLFGRGRRTPDILPHNAQALGKKGPA